MKFNLGTTVPGLFYAPSARSDTQVSGLASGHKKPRHVGDELHFSLQRGRDSNPRNSFPFTHFPGVLLQPLGHLSVYIYGLQK